MNSISKVQYYRLRIPYLKYWKAIVTQKSDNYYAIMMSHLLCEWFVGRTRRFWPNQSQIDGWCKLSSQHSLSRAVQSNLELSTTYYWRKWKPEIKPRTKATEEPVGFSSAENAANVGSLQIAGPTAISGVNPATPTFIRTSRSSTRNPRSQRRRSGPTHKKCVRNADSLASFVVPDMPPLKARIQPTSASKNTGGKPR